MSELFEDEKTQLPSLFRAKAEAAVWTLIFGAVFFIAFFSMRSNFAKAFPTGLENVMQPAEWSMAIACALTVFCTFLFSKIYYAFNPEFATGNTQLLRLINKKIDNLHSTIPEMKADISEIKDVVITYADKVPEVPI